MSTQPAAPKPPPKTNVFGSDVAPIVYFDGVVAIGVRDGIAKIELAADHLVPVTGGSEPMAKVVSTGHLRCGLVAARTLRDALNSMLKSLEGTRDG